MSSPTALATDISLPALLYFAPLLRCVTSTRGPQTWHDPREPRQAVFHLSGFHTVLFCILGNGVETEPKENVHNSQHLHTFLARSLKYRPRVIVGFNQFPLQAQQAWSTPASRLHRTSSLWAPHVIGGALVLVHVVSGTGR
jgi:hypothetical protein